MSSLRTICLQTNLGPDRQANARTDGRTDERKKEATDSLVANQTEYCTTSLAQPWLASRAHVLVISEASLAPSRAAAQINRPSPAMVALSRTLQPRGHRHHRLSLDQWLVSYGKNCARVLYICLCLLGFGRQMTRIAWRLENGKSVKLPAHSKA